MKMWKRLAATLLAAVLAMVMLTACGDDLAGVMRDEDMEASVAYWVKQYAKSYGYTIDVDEEMDPAVNSSMPAVVASWKAYNKGNTNQAGKYADQWKAIVKNKMQGTGKKAYYCMSRCEEGTLTQSYINGELNEKFSGIVSSLKGYGVTPKSIAVGVTKEPGESYLFIIISD